MFASMRVLRRALVGAALFGVASLTTLQAVTPAGGSASAAVIASDACGTVLTKPDGPLDLLLRRQLRRAMSLDTTKWITQPTALTGFRSGQTCFTTSSKNIGCSAASSS